jgi:hypothetical protein
MVSRRRLPGDRESLTSLPWRVSGMYSATTDMLEIGCGEGQVRASWLIGTQREHLTTYLTTYP